MLKYEDEKTTVVVPKVGKALNLGNLGNTHSIHSFKSIIKK